MFLRAVFVVHCDYCLHETLSRVQDIYMSVFTNELHNLSYQVGVSSCIPLFPHLLICNGFSLLVVGFWLSLLTNLLGSVPRIVFLIRTI